MVQAPLPRTERLWFMDNLKVFLTLLVIVHHVGQAYGPTGGFWPFENPERWPYLGYLFWVDASFFMGLFFFISGYFLPGSFDRNGPTAFLKDRVLRLGLPLLTFFVAINPVQMYVSYIHFRGGTLPFFRYWSEIYFGLGARPAHWIGPSWPDLNFGHLWYVEHLLVYALLYALWRVLRKQAPEKKPTPAPGDLAILGYMLALTVISLAVRIWFPIDRWIGFLGFIQMEPAHLPQYLSLFVFGTMAYRRGWLQTLPTARGLRWLGVGVAGVVLGITLPSLPHMAISPALVSTMRVLAESMIATGMSVGLVTLFRARGNQTSSLRRTLSADAYGAYLVHAPLVVVLQYAAAPLPAGPLSKFLLVSLLAIPASFLTSHLLRKLPGFAAVL